MLALALALAVASSAASTAPAQAPRKGGGEPPRPLPTVDAAWEHDLSTPTGVVALTWPAIAYDRVRSEAYVVSDGFVRIFNATGMEIHRFGDDGSIGAISRVAILDDGDIVALTKLDEVPALMRCDYRGEPVVRFGLTGLPQGFADFQPDLLVSRNGKLYLAERGRGRVVVADPDGAYRQSFRLDDLIARVLPADGGQRVFPGIDGFGVDSSGNLLVTMSVLFTAAVVSPAGEVRLFGSRGSTPGRFNNVGGIDADESGNLYVTDRLRSVVSVWSRDLKHLGDFGYRGWDPSNLLTPFEIVVGNGRVFVAQAGRRGVKVYRVELIFPPPPPPPAPAAAPPATRSARGSP
jgi:hypothetical protein